jgi:hypothetical protein
VFPRAKFLAQPSIQPSDFRLNPAFPAQYPVAPQAPLPPPIQVVLQLISQYWPEVVPEHELSPSSAPSGSSSAPSSDFLWALVRVLPPSSFPCTARGSQRRAAGSAPSASILLSSAPRTSKASVPVLPPRKSPASNQALNQMISQPEPTRLSQHGASAPRKVPSVSTQYSAKFCSSLCSQCLS